MMAPLVRFVGDDRPARHDVAGRLAERQLKRKLVRRLPRPEPGAERAYNLFLSGHGTDYIALSMHIDEPEALRLVSVERSRRKQLASPYAEASR